ncbi:DeoR/GlpR family DNA-binding transcription regulator [Plantactinospora endophytica]|uniref:Lactose phosphotransferase system repressor n=1 Tax=Plantactinospora endophytica TaxID=673535 RepID=A0ABQ4DZB8_9ACTN|nr:DeoR/GlpR family DNA-binding transcription regulator [Plantactinospora endophytica]GIG87814.1 DeoR family transcriptional regulator [Plantactinospora endophytica]
MAGAFVRAELDREDVPGRGRRSEDVSVGDGRLSHAPMAERRDLLTQVVVEQGYCTISELARRFGVSEMTIRRDIAYLVDRGRLRAFHGGAAALSPADLLGSDYRARDLSMAAAKRAIAERALELVEPGSVIAIDAGTTANQLASLLSPAMGLKVVTQSLPVVSALAMNPGVELECLGGTLHSESMSFSGPATLAAISELHIDTLFLAASALNERGALCANGFDAITKRALIEVSETVVLIADSSKFSKSARVRICDWQVPDRFVVDDGLSDGDRGSLADLGVVVDEARARPTAGEVRRL